MLIITVPETELFDEKTSMFNKQEEVTLELEHSLFSLSKWEQIYEKPFLSEEPKTTEEVYDYIRVMNRTPNVAPEVFLRLSQENLSKINKYMNAKMTATWFTVDSNSSTNKRVITAELIYYWMFSCGIELECAHWHLSQLFTLIKVFNAENAPKKKMSPDEIRQRNSDLNRQRREATGSPG